MKSQMPTAPVGYSLLRSLSAVSPVYLCRENASGRLLVIKFAGEKDRSLFENEIRALVRLEGYRHAPKLRFAVAESAGNGYLGLEYRSGRSLLEFEGQWSGEPYKKFQRAIQAAVRSLHEDWYMSHSDISPKNVLVDWPQGEAADPLVTLVDWEFASLKSEQNTDTFQKFRGTLGFSPIDPESDPMAKDWRAVEACLRFVSLPKTARILGLRRLRWLP